MPENIETTPPFDTRHLILPCAGRLTEMLPPMLDISTERVTELLNLGSVYLNKKRVTEDQEVPSLSYIRIHCKPKRYPVTELDWSQFLVFENEHFIIVDKPPGFPVPSAVDNIRETVFAQIQTALKLKLFITQRLDVPTQGLTLFAKTADFQRSFNSLLAQGKIHKEYSAKTTGAPPLGIHVHYMRPSRGAPREVLPIPEHPTWKECRLDVLETKEFAGPTALTKIHLLTGRTHQIRAQMRAMGTPLWGDLAYGAPGSPSEFYLLSNTLKFTCPLTNHDFRFNARR